MSLTAIVIICHSTPNLNSQQIIDINLGSTSYLSFWKNHVRMLGNTHIQLDMLVIVVVYGNQRTVHLML